MDLRELKESIETNTFKPTNLILLAKDKFIPLMYLEALSKTYDMNYLDSFDMLPTSFSLFEVKNNKNINVIFIEKVEFIPDFVYNNDNVIVVASNVPQEVKKTCMFDIIEIPELEEWQIKDLVYSFCAGVEDNKLEWMLSICNNNIYRLYNECLKLSIFQENERKHLFNQMIDDNVFDDLSSKTIFDFTNAIMRKDIQSLERMFIELENIDINEFGLITVLYNNFSNLFKIQLGINQTPNSLGIKQGQFNAIKRLIGAYSGEQLIKAFNLITDMDRKVKNGEFPVPLMKDYLVTSILSF